MHLNPCGQMGAKLFGKCCPMCCWHQCKLAHRAIQIIPIVARRHMKMVVPNILIACRFIVLARRYAIAVKCSFHGDRYGLCCGVDGGGKFSRQGVQVLMMCIGDDQRVAGVVGPLVRTDHGQYMVILEDDVISGGADDFIRKLPRCHKAEWALIGGWCVTFYKHRFTTLLTTD